MQEMLTTITSLYTAHHKGTKDTRHYKSVYLSHHKGTRETHHDNISVYNSP